MKRRALECLTASLAVRGNAGCSKAPGGVRASSIEPQNFRRTGSVDERFQFYNVEMVEVIGGRFWKPYKDIAAPPTAQESAKQSGNHGEATPAGMDAGLYQQRPPIDLANRRLRKLAAALGPAYVRVSGTWRTLPTSTIPISRVRRRRPKASAEF
jgi:heparanase 1